MVYSMWMHIIWNLLDVVVYQGQYTDSLFLRFSFNANSLTSKLALGTVYRVSGAESYLADPRILVRLRWQDSKGYFAKGKIKKDEPVEEHIFAIPEDVFLKGAYVPTEGRMASQISA